MHAAAAAAAAASSYKKLSYEIHRENFLAGHLCCWHLENGQNPYCPWLKCCMCSAGRKRKKDEQVFA